MTVLDHATDRDLLDLVRAGNAGNTEADAAFAELFARHAGVTRGYALRYSTDVAEAEDIAAEAFFRVLQAVRRGNGPDDNMRGYLLTVVRRLAAEWHTRSRDVPTADEELRRRVDPDVDHTADRAEAHLISRAFASLPQRWRSVLWQVEVEGARPAVVARRFGLSANATAALARRAREGLRAAYLQEHVPTAIDSTGCRAVADRLGVYTAGGVRKAEAERIRAHLAACPSCRSVHAELADVCAGLRRYAGALTPPVIGVGVAAAAYRGLAGRSVRTVGRAMSNLAGKAAVAGARFKLVVAATSMVAVGGVGIASGPLLHESLPQLRPDSGDNLAIPVGPQGVPASSSGSGGLGRGGAMGSGQSPTGQPNGGLSNTTGATSRTSTPTQRESGGVLPVNNQDGNRSGPLSPAHGSSGNQLYSGSPVTTAPTVVPTSGSPDPTMQPATGNETVWSTVWTTDGTTIWETVWRSSGP